VTKAKEILKMVEDTDQLVKQQVDHLQVIASIMADAALAAAAYDKWLKDNHVQTLLGSKATALGKAISTAVDHVQGIV
jgi:hypothetical protein